MVASWKAKAIFTNRLYSALRILLPFLYLSTNCVTDLIKNYKIHTTSTQLKQVFWVGTCFWDTDIKAESNWTMSVCSACIWAGVVDKRLIQIKSKCIHLLTVRRSINKYRYFRLTDASLLVPKILIDIR